jgi:hypothetical protein
MYTDDTNICFRVIRFIAEGTFDLYSDLVTPQVSEYFITTYLLANKVMITKAYYETLLPLFHVGACLILISQEHERSDNSYY